jgi:pimeloyl-ACP methyl ester carboxylesterase
LIPGARRVVLDGTGHFAALEAPDEVARMLLGVAP